jgi:hypothetical protein
MFFGDEKMVEILMGSLYPPFPIAVCQFIPPNSDFLLVSNLHSSSNDREETYATITTLPYGIRNCSLDQLRERVKEHIDISTCEHLQVDLETLSGRILQAICRLRGAYPTLEGVNTYPSLAS